MNKAVFEKTLRSALAKLPQKEVNDSINYYLEIINDKMDNGESEEAAVSELGSISSIVDAIAVNYVSNMANEAKNGPRQEPPPPVPVKKTLKTFYKSWPEWLKILVWVTAIAWAPALFGVAVGIAGVAFGLVVAFCAVALSGIVCLLYTLPNILFGIMAGAGFWEIIWGTGSLLIAGSVLCFLTIGIYPFAKSAIAFTKEMYGKAKEKIKAWR